MKKNLEICNDKLEEIKKREGKKTEDPGWQENKQKYLAGLRSRFEKESEVFRWQRGLMD